MADAASVSSRMAETKDGEEAEQPEEGGLENNVRAMIDSSHFNDFVDQVQGGGDDDNLFLLAYSHAANNKEEDQRYLQIMFRKYAEQAWDQKGHKLEGQMNLTKKGARKLAHEVLQNWKGLTNEENDSYIAQNFDSIWSKFDNANKGGVLNQE